MARLLLLRWLVCLISLPPPPNPCLLDLQAQGLLALAFSIFTLRYYCSLLPPEIAAVLAGAVLTLAAGALLRTLRPARFGLASLPNDEPRHFNLKNLIQTQTAYAPNTPTTGGGAVLRVDF